MLLHACQKLPTIQYESCALEEIEEMEVMERGVSVVTFRDHVSDIVLKAYFLLMKHFNQEGGNLIF